MLVQERIEELNSIIIDVFDDKIKLTGFLSEERLFDYYEKGSECRFSVEVYPKEEFNIAYAKDNAIIILREHGVEIGRYKFIPLKRDTVKYKDIDKNNRSRSYTIRQCYYTKKFNYKDSEKSILFDDETSLREYFWNEFNSELNYTSI